MYDYREKLTDYVIFEPDNLDFFVRQPMGSIAFGVLLGVCSKIKSLSGFADSVALNSLKRVWIQVYLILSKACPISAIISSVSSMPMENLIKDGDMPALHISSSPIPE